MLFAEKGPLLSNVVCLCITVWRERAVDDAAFQDSAETPLLKRAKTDTPTDAR